MNIFDIIFLGIGLAADATAVSITNGMIESKMNLKKMLFIALTFGIFQGLMPITGYYSGKVFSEFISSIDNYIAFAILLFLGVKMIIESQKKDEEEDYYLSYSKILLQGIATSIDALMVGITFALYEVKIYEAGLIIAFITAVLCLMGVKLGKKCGDLVKKGTEIIGGIILIILSVKFLIEEIFF